MGYTLSTNEEEKIQDILRIEGIGAKGGGILPKYVLLDPDLTLEAKCIYSYFCSLAGKGTIAFPGRDTIIGHLQITKDTYYKHLKLLIDQNYIVVSKQRSQNGFAHNVYTLISNPKKFQDEPQNMYNEKFYSRIRFSGLKAGGYGWIPYIVMTDLRLNVKAKGIYAYFCVYTGSGDSAFPKKESILKDLKITHNTYQKYYRQLIDLNYLSVVQRRANDSGQMSINDYFLNDNPQIEFQNQETENQIQDLEKKQDSKISDIEKEPDTKISDTEKEPGTKISDTEKEPDTKISDIEEPSTKISDTQDVEWELGEIQNIGFRTPDTKISDIEPDTNFSDTNINSIYTKTNLFTHSIDIKTLENIKLSDSTKDMTLMSKIISVICDWNILYPELDGQKHDQELLHKIHVLFVQGLEDLCCMDGEQQIRGSNITKFKVIEMIEAIRLVPCAFEKYCMDVIDDYRQALKNITIKNHMGYMKSCIWTRMLTFGVIDAQRKNSTDNIQNHFHNFHQRDTDYDSIILQNVREGLF